MNNELGVTVPKGFVTPGFEAVGEQFERNLAERGDRGAAFSVVLDGRPIIDLWGGLADRQQRIPWGPETIA
jgi:hypothetical protein